MPQACQMARERRVFLPRLIPPLRPGFHFAQCGRNRFGELGGRSGKLPTGHPARRLGFVAFAQARVAILLGPALLVLQILDLAAAGRQVLAVQVVERRVIVVQHRLTALLLGLFSGVLGFQSHQPLVEKARAQVLLVVVQPRAQVPQLTVPDCQRLERGVLLPRRRQKRSA